MNDAELVKLAAGIKMGNSAPGEAAPPGKGYSGIFEKKAARADRSEARGAPLAAAPEGASLPRSASAGVRPGGGAEGGGGQAEGARFTAMFKDVRDGANVPTFPAPQNPQKGQGKKDPSSACCGCKIL